MYRSVYDLKEFYNSVPGRVVRRVLQGRIRTIWPDVHGLSVMGCGYATPYLRAFKEEAASRVFAVMPAAQGAHHWPQGGDEKNLACLAEEFALPFETNSIDRILLIHDLEFSERLHTKLREIWRVLKGNGRILVVVPNRSGMWSHADWSPFGRGTPYSESQICYYLRDNGFVCENTQGGLFMPPTRYSMLLKSAGFFERFGPAFAPFFAGVHIVEASKQLYAPVDKGSGVRSRVRVQDGRRLIPKPAAQWFTS